MRLILPSDFGQKWLLFALLLLGCQHAGPPPVPPGEPIPAEPDLVVGTMEAECDGLVAAIAAYGICPNADEDTKVWSKRVAEVAQQAFDAGKKADPKPEDRKVIALACHKATVSMQNASERCKNGPPPKDD
jgi:hypothetical protein